MELSQNMLLSRGCAEDVALKYGFADAPIFGHVRDGIYNVMFTTNDREVLQLSTVEFVDGSFYITDPSVSHVPANTIEYIEYVKSRL